MAVLRLFIFWLVCVAALSWNDHIEQKMTTDPFLPMDDHSAAVFTAKGIDVTPNKDQGVIKVIFLFNFFGLCLGFLRS